MRGMKDLFLRLDAIIESYNYLEVKLKVIMIYENRLNKYAKGYYQFRRISKSTRLVPISDCFEQGYFC